MAYAVRPASVAPGQVDVGVHVPVFTAGAAFGPKVVAQLGRVPAMEARSGYPLTAAFAAVAEASPPNARVHAATAVVSARRRLIARDMCGRPFDVFAVSWSLELRSADTQPATP